jgi:DNA-dependent RNA polymerase auxiliary subunit epsilon
MMPYILLDRICKKCGESGKLFRNRWNKKASKWYLQSSCKDCERISTKIHQENNREKWREYNRNSYLNKIGGYLSRRSYLEMTDELRKEWYRDKAIKRATRAKRARVIWEREFTEFSYMEAHELRKVRNIVTGIEWHVDHIIPLKGEFVCGLHTWNNFAVIPKVDNLRKGNKHSIYEERKA